MTRGRFIAVAMALLVASIALVLNTGFLAALPHLLIDGGFCILWLISACAMLPPGLLWGDEPNGYDVLEYHLQVPREWYELGRIVPLQHNVFSFLPFNVEMHYLLAMHLRGGPWAAMYLAQLMHVAFIAI